jgi:hypothetical protein
MVKTITALCFILFSLHASESFEDACLKCHVENNVPTDVIYKRYLLKYSSKDKIREAMVTYLKKPIAERTIMPPRFIDIFGLKEMMKLSDAELNKYVNELIDSFDVKKKLTL